jgi:uncharacterized protein YdbL (DUF1318 family)
MFYSTRQFGWCVFICLGLLTACVTVNVYFPAAAAEEAADQIIDEVWGGSPAAAKPTASELRPSQGLLWRQRRSLALLDVLVPAAQAAPNLNIDTPGINKIKASMGARFNQLKPFYQNGAVGLTRDGLVAVRDMNAVPGNQRKNVNQLVAGENRDRNALYREIAKANGHPEWETNIRATFAEQWINKAPSGYWIQGPGGWRRK